MEKELIFTIASRLKEQHVVSFRLYNAIYMIVLTDKGYFINQFGMDVRYFYESLKDLFEKYVVYGDSLINLIDDIKLC